MNAVLTERVARGTLFQPVDIGHPVYAAVTDPQTAFWALVDKTRGPRSRQRSRPARRLRGQSRTV